MPTPTQQEAEAATAQFIEDQKAFHVVVKGGKDDTIVNDDGETLKSLSRVIFDLSEQDIGETAAANINNRLGSLRLGLEALFGVPLAFIVNGNVNETSIATPALNEASTFEAYIVATNTGLPIVNADGKRFRVTNGGRDLNAGELPGGVIAKFQTSIAGAAFVLQSTRPAIGGGGGDGALLSGIRTDAAAARRFLEGLFGFPLAMPSNGDQNRLVVEGQVAPNDGQTIDAMIAATNTGAASLVYGGVDLRITANGGGAALAGGELPSGRIATFEYSYGGQAWVLRGVRTIDLGNSGAEALPVGAQDADLINKPWGTITNNGSAGSVIASIIKTVVVPGSSNAATSNVPADALPSDFIKNALNDLQPGTGITYNVDLVARPGAPFSDAGSQLANSQAFLAGKATYVIPFFWANECRTLWYCDSGGVAAQFGALFATVGYAQQMGAEVILCTGFPADPRADPASAVPAYDPLYFSDTRDYPNGGSTRNMVYPVGKLAPVSPTADMVPSATAANFMLQRDWTGGGVVRTGFSRLWHWNRSVRAFAAQLGLKLWDFEYSTYQRCIEIFEDKADGLDLFYNKNDPLHPLSPLFHYAVKPIILQWARAEIEGRNDIRVFKGDDINFKIGKATMPTQFADKSVASLSANQAAGTEEVISSNPQRKSIAITPVNDGKLYLKSGATGFFWPVYAGVTKALSGNDCPTNALFITGQTVSSTLAIAEG